MCQIKILINVEQNPHWSIITSMLCSECWVFTEHRENTPMLSGGGSGTTQPLPRDGGAKELRGNPTVETHPKVWTIGQE